MAMDDPDHWQLAIEPAQPRKTALLYLALNLPGCAADLQGPEPSLALHNAVLAVLARAMGSADTVIQIDAGTFACLMRQAPRRETLSLCSWALLDAVATLAFNSKSSASWRVAIGISMGWARDARYSALLRNADAAMHRARHQRSGFAFFDERVDVWELVASETEVPGV